MATEKSKPAPNSLPPNLLRDRAEEILQKTHRDVSRMPIEDVHALVYELQVHQMELSLQNEDLRQAQAALGESLDRYTDLYEFAPIGYLTLDFDGRITEANLAAATLLGVDRKDLVGSNMTDFVVSDSQDEFYLHRQSLLTSGNKHTCELRLQQQDGTPLVIRLESVASGAPGETLFRVALIDITAKDRAEKALGTLNETLEQRVEERTTEVNLLAEALSHLGEGVLLTSDGLDWPGPQIVFVNAAMCGITGYSPEDLIGQSPRILQGQDTDRKALEHLRRELSAGRPCLIELLNYRKDGSSYDAELFVTPLADKTGHRTNFVSIHRDITERKRAARAVQESEAQLKSILTSLSAHIAVLDGEGTILAVNPAWEKFAADNEGIPQRCSIGANYLEVCRNTTGEGAKEAHQIADGLQAVLDGSSSNFSCEYPCHSQTEERWFLLHATRLQDGAIGAVVSHTNISEQKLATVAQKSLANILEESLNEIYIFDAESLKFLEVNRGARENLGYDIEELRSLTPVDLKPTYNRKRFNALLEPLRSGRKTKAVFQTSHQRRDGSLYDVEVHVQMTSFAGKPCFVAIVLDTTSRRLLEQEVLNAAEEERQRIAHDLHDDLGSLLTGIKLRVEALRTTLADHDEEAASSSSAIAKLISEAMVKTRGIARGLRPVGTDPEDLMSALRSLSSHLASATELRCRFVCPEPVLIDDPIAANHLYRIAQEATNNAVKHAGGTSLTISLEKRKDGIELRIADDGTGFDYDVLKRDGLGLHIINYRTHAIHGSLQVRRRKKGGTRVACTMPLSTPPAPST